MLVRIGYRMLGNLEDARDAVQETFLRMWKSGKGLDAQTSPRPLLIRILTNLCIDQLRRRKQFRLFSLDREENRPVERELPSSDDPHRNLESRELGKRIEDAVAQLAPKQKTVFVLRDMEGYSVKEVAEMVGRSKNTVLVNLHLARKNLRQRLSDILEAQESK
jgi:RNA polymerase sigma-70 factor (ECF subfamily)